MKNKKRILSLLLGVIMLLAVLLNTVGCASDEEEETGEYTREISTADDGLRYDEKGYLMDDIPEDLNYDGKEVNILTCREMSYTVCPEEIQNVVLYDTVYNRNLIIQDRLGVKLNWVLVEGVASTMDTFIQATANAGEGDYDLICAYSLTPTALAMNGYLENLNDVEHLAFDKPWWSTSVLENRFHDTIFFSATTSSTPVLRQMFVTYYNRQMLAENKVEDPEQLVIDGGWTIDVMKKYSKNFYQDIDGNQKKSLLDIYGTVVMGKVTADSFFYGCGFNVVSINQNTGMPEFCAAGDDYMPMAYFVSDMVSWLCQTNDAYCPSTSEGCAEFLTENRTAFYVSQLTEVDKMPDVKNWGVLPMPKLDTEQEDYVTAPGNAFDVWCIRKGARDLAMSGAVLECYASESYRYSAPLYYEESLSPRYSNDMNGIKIFELIRSNLEFDFGRLSNKQLGNFDEFMRNSYMSGNNQLIQEWATNGKSMQRKLTSLLDAYKEAGAQ